VGPGEVPPHNDFNDLECQTSLTALPGAKGIFQRCQTGKFQTQNADVYEPRAMSAVGEYRSLVDFGARSGDQKIRNTPDTTKKINTMRRNIASSMQSKRYKPTHVPPSTAGTQNKYVAVRPEAIMPSLEK